MARYNRKIESVSEDLIGIGRSSKRTFCPPLVMSRLTQSEIKTGVFTIFSFKFKGYITSGTKYPSMICAINNWLQWCCPFLSNLDFKKWPTSQLVNAGAKAFTIKSSSKISRVYLFVWVQYRHVLHIDLLPRRSADMHPRPRARSAAELRNRAQRQDPSMVKTSFGHILFIEQSIRPFYNSNLK
jgi:hypothetical protein